MRMSVVSLCAVAALGGRAEADVAIDVRDDRNGSAILQNPISGQYVFSFQPQHTNLAGAGIWVQRWDNTATLDLTYTLLDGLPGTGAVLASGTAHVTTDSFPASFNGGPASDAFWSPVGVTPGQTYSMQLSWSSASGFNGNFRYTPIIPASFDDADLYAGGGKFTTASPAPDSHWSINYEVFYDTVPAPGVFVSGVVGGVLACGRRRRAGW